jgi:hypothetical protein
LEPFRHKNPAIRPNKAEKLQVFRRKRKVEDTVESKGRMELKDPDDKRVRRRGKTRLSRIWIGFPFKL